MSPTPAEIFARYVKPPSPSAAPWPLPTYPSSIPYAYLPPKDEGLTGRDRRIRCGIGEVYDRSRNRCVRRSNWSFWGRWVLLALALGFILLLFVLFCVRSRRARRRGARPMYGTGWMAPAGGKFAPAPPQQQWGAPPGGYGMQGQPPPPPPPAYGQEHYGPPPPGPSPYAGYGPPDGGIQQPPGTYQPVYSPPTGPPPGK